MSLLFSLIVLLSPHNPTLIVYLSRRLINTMILLSLLFTFIVYGHSINKLYPNNNFRIAWIEVLELLAPPSFKLFNYVVARLAVCRRGAVVLLPAARQRYYILCIYRGWFTWVSGTYSSFRIWLKWKIYSQIRFKTANFNQNTYLYRRQRHELAAFPTAPAAWAKRFHNSYSYHCIPCWVVLALCR